jgi:prepilin-type N-terminal cleavage/methylation domain-containing protein
MIDNSGTKNKKAGFSLIELLIVIAIIGILSTIILNSLSESRARAYDSKIKQQLSSFRTAAELYFASRGDNYAPAAVSCSSINSIFNDFSPQTGSPGLYIADGNLPPEVQKACRASASAYAVKVSLYKGTSYWCIDSKGFSGEIEGQITGPTTICP